MNAVIVEAQVRALAYQLYEERGCQDGYAEEDWQQAEKELLSKAKAASAA